jgi:hypothetical protein
VAKAAGLELLCEIKQLGGSDIHVPVRHGFAILDGRDPADGWKHRRGPEPPPDPTLVATQVPRRWSGSKRPLRSRAAAAQIDAFHHPSGEWDLTSSAGWPFALALRPAETAAETWH